MRLRAPLLLLAGVSVSWEPHKAECLEKRKALEAK